jgi:hypothetical protein
MSTAMVLLQEDRKALEANVPPRAVWGIGLHRLALSETHSKLARLCPVRKEEKEKEKEKEQGHRLTLTTYKL